VPEEVHQLLNIGEVNFQRQIDGAYLLSKTSGQVASHFNKVAKFDQIDTSQQNIDKHIRELKSTIKHKEVDLKKNKEDIKQFDYLEEVETKLELLEQEESRLLNLRKRKLKLENLISLYESKKSELEELNQIISIEKPLDNLLRLVEQRADLEKKYKKLNMAIITIEHIKRRLKRLSTVVKLEEPVLHVIQLYNRRETLDAKRIRLKEAIFKLLSTQVSLNKAKGSFQLLSKKYNEEFPDVCPLCGLEVPHNHKEIDYGKNKK
jgi:DNA repair exonuclease SbcCD ATPase subunit